jgi:hypothetical protein
MQVDQPNLGTNSDPVGHQLGTVAPQRVVAAQFGDQLGTNSAPFGHQGSDRDETLGHDWPARDHLATSLRPRLGFCRVAGTEVAS